MATILVTGASKGFGYLTSKSLLAKGHKVVASMRGVASRNQAVADELRKAGAAIVELDVTNDASVVSGVEQAIKAAGKLDVVVNNAGVGVLGIQECFTIDDFKRVFDINVFGVQRVNRAVLPHMRERKTGLLVHVSSLLGRMVIPFYGPYNASKFALEAMVDNYRIELSQWGIEAVLVEPGGYGTDFADSLIRPSDTARAKTYGPMADAPEASLKAFEKNFEGPNAPNPQWVADAIVQVIDTPRGQRPFRTTVDRLGMGAAIDPYNKAIEDIQQKVYGAFGMGHVLKLKMD